MRRRGQNEQKTRMAKVTGDKHYHMERRGSELVNSRYCQRCCVTFSLFCESQKAIHTAVNHAVKCLVEPFVMVKNTATADTYVLCLLSTILVVSVT